MSQRMGPQPEFLIQLRVEESERLDQDRVTRLIEYLGGIATLEGFAFYTLEGRQEAMDVLVREYGHQYFELVNSPQSPR